MADHADTADPETRDCRPALSGNSHRRRSRIVDPGDPGGGVRRRVTIFYGSATKPAWESVWGAVEFYAFTNLALLGITGCSCCGC